MNKDRKESVSITNIVTSSVNRALGRDTNEPCGRSGAPEAAHPSATRTGQETPKASSIRAKGSSGASVHINFQSDEDRDEGIGSTGEPVQLGSGSRSSRRLLRGWRRKLSLSPATRTKLTASSSIYIYLLLICILFIAIFMVWYLKGLIQQIPQEISNVRKAWNCISLRVALCHRHRVGYSYISLPNQLGQNDQEQIGEELLQYERLISVKCYALLPLFLCSIYAPKCNSSGQVLPPCKSLCKEATRKCDFFLKVFSLSWPLDLNCESLQDSSDPDVCVGFRENQLHQRKSQVCGHDGFRCDVTRCTPKNWICDGFIDCQDGSDERNCSHCNSNQFHCGSGVCIMKEDICDGIKDCPDSRDERQCLRLSKYMGVNGEGRLEAWSASGNNWKVVCGENWDSSYMSAKACRMLGYREANETYIRDETRSIKSRSGLGAVQLHEKTKTLFYKGRNKGCSSSSNQVAVYLHCNHFECGKTAAPFEVASRIVGGIESLPGQWPWLVGLHGGNDEVFFCGGILISQWWVLSAAHCVGNQTDPKGWLVQLGLSRRTASPLFVRKRKVSQISKHPSFNSANLYGNDIALLLLESPVDFDEFLRPVCLPPDDIQLEPETKCTVVGWGKPVHDDDADYLNVVHEVEVPIVPHDVCTKWYSLQDVPIAATMLCAGYPEGQKDACQGDSGGPLLCRDPHRRSWYVAGVVSWGINCAQPNLPGIYTNVVMYKEWIRTVSKNQGYPVNF